MKIIQILLLAIICLTTPSCCRNGCRDDVVCETYMHRYGLAVPPQEWSEQGETGQVLTTLKDGVTIRKNYSDGQLHGVTTYSFPHKDLVAKTETYENGRLVHEEEFFASGLPRRQFDHEQNLARHYYDQGTLRSVEQTSDDHLIKGKYYNLKENVESSVEDGEGIKTLRDDYGQLTAIFTVSGGQIIEKTTFHPNGMPLTVEPYRDGLIHGTRKTFLPSGEPLTFEQWQHGAANGVTVVYEQGEKVAEVPYVNGQKNGLECRFVNEVAIVEEIHWQDDMRHGPSIRYFEGQSFTDWYLNDSKVTKAYYDQRIGPNSR